MLEISQGAFVSPRDEHNRYTGRIDFANGEEPQFIWAGSQVTLRFRGTAVWARLRNRPSWGRQYIGWVVDGGAKGMARLHPDSQMRTYALVDNLDDGEHEIILYKRMDATGYVGFGGWHVLGETLEALPAPARRMECFGDSVSMGAVVDAPGFEGKTDPPNDGHYDDAWLSYISMAARELGAELHNNSQGGISLLDGTGYFRGPDYLGLESCWDKTGYVPELGLSPWDFSRWKPHVVVLAVAQNDPHPDNDIAEAPEKRSRWVRRYGQLLADMRAQYPRALFVLTTTIVNHNLVWEDALDEVCAACADERVVRLRFKRAAVGTPGHPRAAEQGEMARELVDLLNSYGEELWQ